MNPSPLYAGLDIGTASVRLALLDRQGTIEAQATEAIKTWRDEDDPRIAEQSTEDIWRAIKACFLATSSTADLSRVQGFGLDATCSLAVTDSSGRAVSVSKATLGQTTDERNVILWMDHRAEQEADAINETKHSELEAVGESLLLLSSARPKREAFGFMHVELDMPKILWLRNKLGDGFKDLVLFSLADYFSFRLSGLLQTLQPSTPKLGSARYIKPSMAYQPAGGFSRDFLACVGLQDMHIDASLTFKAGQPLPAASASDLRDLGLPEDTIIACPLIDCYAGYVGTIGYPSPNGSDIKQCKSRLAAVAGTSTCIILESPIAASITGVWGPYKDSIFAGWSLSMGGQSATGDLLAHIIDSHPAKAKLDTAQDSFAAVQKVLDEAVKRKGLSSAVQLASKAFIYPDFRGNRCPLNDGDMTGLMSGLTIDDSLLDLAIKYQVAMEGIALQMKHIVEAFRNAGHSITEMCVSGSQALNGPLLQLIANVCRLPVAAPTQPALSVVSGSAQLARYAVEVRLQEGTFEASVALNKAMKHRDLLWRCMEMTPANKRIEPNASAKDTAILDVKWAMFLDTIKMQQKWNAQMKSATKV